MRFDWNDSKYFFLDFCFIYQEAMRENVRRTWERSSKFLTQNKIEIHIYISTGLQWQRKCWAEETIEKYFFVIDFFPDTHGFFYLFGVDVSLALDLPTIFNNFGSAFFINQTIFIWYKQFLFCVTRLPCTFFFHSHVRFSLYWAQWT